MTVNAARGMDEIHHDIKVCKNKKKSFESRFFKNEISFLNSSKKIAVETIAKSGSQPIKKLWV